VYQLDRMTSHAAMRLVLMTSLTALCINLTE